MKNWIRLTFNNVFFGVLLTLIGLSVFSAISKYEFPLNSPIPLFVPILLIVFFYKYNFLSIPVILFLLFSFLGDVYTVFFTDEAVILNLLTYKLSSIFYILSYISLIVVAVSKFKILAVDKLVGIYLVVVFSINLYFLYTIFEILKVLIPDASEITMFGLNSLLLMILGFISFGVYLNTQTKQSISFLIAAICFAFSVILNYINLYYVYDWSLVMLNRAIYALGLYHIFRHLIIENKNRTPEKVKIQDGFSSDNVLV